MFVVVVVELGLCMVVALVDISMVVDFVFVSVTLFVVVVVAISVVASDVDIFFAVSKVGVVCLHVIFLAVSFPVGVAVVVLGGVVVIWPLVYRYIKRASIWI